jgi:RIO kinase 1
MPESTTLNENEQYDQDCDSAEEELYFNALTLDDEWDETDGDFTKKYNRMKNQLSAMGNQQLPGEATGVKGQILNQINQRVAAKQDELSSKYGNRINLVELFQPGQRKLEDRHVLKDKADRATVEQVLDPRTRVILYKLINNEVLYEINGCISTGKEANVYHAITPEKQDDPNAPPIKSKHVAVKIYKTSILVFKDRDRYVTGEYRFRHGYSKSNPRKMVQLWAEKEMRNLKRLHQANIPCPDTVCLKMHVLVMDLIGSEDGWAAPRLKDASIESREEYLDIYRQLVKILWKMYHKCKLVHADFSEYNLLYHEKKIYVIDVSQSVEHDHPHALEFLRKDCSNTVDFVRKTLDVQIVTVRELFDFIVTDLEAFKLKLNVQEEMTEDEVLDAYLNKVCKHYIDSC